MRENTADQAHSIDVISAIEFFDKKATEKDKNNATAFFLKKIHKFHTIITDRRGWSLQNSTEKEQYDSDIGFLQYFINEFLENVKFSAKLKCINGVKMSIRCLIDLSILHFNRGCDRFIPAFFLTDAIENLFSLVTNIFKKPNAKTFPYALRIISLNQFQFNPIKGNCSWDETESVQINFMDLLLKEENHADETQDDDETDFENYEIEINDEITHEMIFKDEYDCQVFFCEVTSFLNKILVALKCNFCKENLIAGQDDEISANELFTLREKNSLGPKSFQPSNGLWKFFKKMEFIFQRLCLMKTPDDKDFTEIFIINANNVLVANEHCIKTTSMLIFLFIKERLKLKLHHYMPHKRLQFASKSLK